MTAAREPARPAWPWWLLLVASLATGAWLRIWQLGDQILLDDEWHAIHKLLQSGMANIASHFGWADYSIPLTLYYRALYDLGWLSEWPMRLPLLLAGLAVLLAPLALRRLPLPTRATWAGLMAISLPLIYFSRTARPYALNCLLVLVAVLAIHRWWRNGQRGGWLAFAYGACTVLGAWLHLLTLVFTALPFVWFGIQALQSGLRRRHWHPLLRLFLLGVATLIPLLVLLLPPLVSDWASMRGKAGLGHMSWDSAWHGLQMAESTGNVLLVAVLCALALIGLIAFWRQARDFTAYALFVAVVGTAVIMLAEPAWIQHAGVLVRYTVPVLPGLLLLIAHGAVTCLQRVTATWLACPAVLLLLWLCYALGPLGYMLYSPNQFMDHTRFAYDPDARTSLLRTGVKLGRIPDFYFQLAQMPPRSVVVAEGPWRLESYFNPLPWYQQLDRQYRRIAMLTPVCGHRVWGEYQPDQRGIHLRQFVHLRDLLAGHKHGIDFLVLHMRPWTRIPPQQLRWPDMRQCLATVTRALGPPIYRDGQIAAFDLREQPRR